jgi:O-antigen ligase
MTKWFKLPNVFVAPGIALVLVAIGGRYTLDRAGLTDLAWVDLRVIGLIIALVPLVVDLIRRPKRMPQHRSEGWLIVTLFFFLFQIASALWSPPGARSGAQTLDLILLGALTVALYLYTLGDPTVVVKTLFTLFFAASVVFALGALLFTSPGEQGRFAAFGGGPNVFVRIEVLGIIAAIAINRFTGRKLPLFLIPLFLLSAILSGSRAGLGMGAIVGAYALWKARRHIKASVVVTSVAVLVVATALTVAFAPPSVTSLFETRFVQQTVEQHYVSDRTSIWQSAWQLFLDHPLAGTGLDGFYGLIGKNQQIEYPHNYVLGVAAEGGVIGLGLLFAAILMCAYTIRKNHGHPRETGLAAAAAVYVALSSLFSGDYYDARLAWLFAAVAAAAAVTPARPAADEAPSAPAGKPVLEAVS